MFKKALVIKVSNTLLLQILIAFLFSVIILYFSHYLAEYGGVSIISGSDCANLFLGCPFSYEHVFEFCRNKTNGILYPNKDFFYLKSVFNHWLLLLIGIIVFTLILQIRVEFRLNNGKKIKTFAENGERSKVHNLITILLALLMAFFIGLLIT